jgi:hypothetical protein
LERVAEHDKSDDRHDQQPVDVRCTERTRHQLAPAMPPGGADVTYGGTIVEDLWRLDSRCQGTGNTAGRH